MSKMFGIRAFILTGLVAAVSVAAEMPTRGCACALIWLWICLLAYETVLCASTAIERLRKKDDVLGDVCGELLYPVVGVLAFFLSPLLFMYVWELVEKFAYCVKVIAISNGF